MDAGFVDEIVARVLEAVEAGAALDPAGWRLLVRRYAETAREDLGAPIAAGLAATLDAAPAGDPAAALLLCADASRVSDDPRLAAAAVDLVAAIRGAWPSARAGEAWRGLDACLQAADLAADPAVVPASIDELERLVARDYEPGEGLGAGADLDLDAAAALLTAYDVTGRLPYAMLADELLQLARRAWPDSFDGRCAAARVCCRLAALHADADYREAAVVAPDADYAADARAVLAAQLEAARARGAGAAVYAIALGEWLALQRELH